MATAAAREADRVTGAIVEELGVWYVIELNLNRVNKLIRQQADSSGTL